MSESRNPELKTHDTRVEIPFEDLNGRIQQKIIFLVRYRSHRALSELFGSLAVSTSLPHIPKVALTVGGYYTGLRAVFANQIQKMHQEIVNDFNRYGVLDTANEGNYPRDWMNPSIVGKTHPTFFVKGNGNIVFMKESKKEYWRYKVQQKKLIQLLGANPWRWRGILRPPTAPESFRKKVAHQLRALTAKVPRMIPPRRRPAFRAIGMHSLQKRRRHRP